MHIQVKCILNKNSDRLCIVSLVKNKIPHLCSNLALFPGFKILYVLDYVMTSNATVYNTTFKQDPVDNLFWKVKSRLRKYNKKQGHNCHKI